MTNAEKIARLTAYLHADYQWPDFPNAWRLEFILHPDMTLEMDLLNPVTGDFWSEEYGEISLPVLHSGGLLSIREITLAKVPYMSSFNHANVSDTPRAAHLKVVPK